MKSWFVHRTISYWTCLLSSETGSCYVVQVGLELFLQHRLAWNPLSSCLRLQTNATTFSFFLLSRPLSSPFFPLLCVLCACVFWDKISMYSPGQAWTHYFSALACECWDSAAATSRSHLQNILISSVLRAQLKCMAKRREILFSLTHSKQNPG